MQSMREDIQIRLVKGAPARLSYHKQAQAVCCLQKESVSVKQCLISKLLNHCYYLEDMVQF
jgi:hypothetical protein